MSIGSQCMTLTISIHALREEGDAPPPAPPAARGDFYPRPPRGGRPRLYALADKEIYFYPRPPRGGRRGAEFARPQHAQFLSTPSARRATTTAKSSVLVLPISIHALREEGDAQRLRRAPQLRRISIHALREEGDSKNREKTLCFCLIIHRSAQIAKRCL